MSGRYVVEVGVALRRPPRLDEWRRVVVLASSGDDAELAACQLAACTSVMPVASVVVDWPDDDARVNGCADVLHARKVADMPLTTQTIPAAELVKGDYLTNGYGVDERPRWSRIAQVQHLKTGRVSVRIASGAWGSTMSGTYQTRTYFAPDALVEVAR